MHFDQIATKADIREVIESIRELKSIISPIKVEKKFLRSSDVRKILNISDGTLQRLRTSNTLNAKKINGTWFYKFNDIQKLMEVGNDK